MELLSWVWQCITKRWEIRGAPELTVRWLPYGLSIQGPSITHQSC